MTIMMIAIAAQKVGQLVERIALAAFWISGSWWSLSNEHDTLIQRDKASRLRSRDHDQKDDDQKDDDDQENDDQKNDDQKDDDQ